jgi:predicted nucleic acid-binding protein
MAGTDPVYYWDSCLFLAWIKDEERQTGDMDGVREVVERAKRREVKIITSVLTLTEVLESRLPAGMKTLMEGLMKRVIRVGMDIKIAKMAHDLRDYYMQRTAEFGGKVLSVPDAIHLATGILNRVTEFHTFDGGKSGSKSLGLLQLSGNVGGHRLTICKPQAKSPQLDLRKPKPSQTTLSSPNAS